MVGDGRHLRPTAGRRNLTPDGFEALRRRTRRRTALTLHLTGRAGLPSAVSQDLDTEQGAPIRNASKAVDAYRQPSGRRDHALIS